MRRCMFNNIKSQQIKWVAIIMVFGVLVVGCSSVSQYEPDWQKASDLNLELAINYIEKGQMDRAKRKLYLAHKQNPQDVDVLTVLAYWYQKQNQDQMAEKWYQKALKQQPHNVSIINNYSDFLCEQGHYHQAIKGFLYVAKHQQNKHRIGEAYENAGLCSKRADNPQKAQHFFKKALAVDGDRLISRQELTISPPTTS